MAWSSFKESAIYRDLKVWTVASFHVRCRACGRPGYAELHTECRKFIVGLAFGKPACPDEKRSSASWSVGAGTPHVESAETAAVCEATSVSSLPPVTAGPGKTLDKLLLQLSDDD